MITSTTISRLEYLMCVSCLSMCGDDDSDGGSVTATNFVILSIISLVVVTDSTTALVTNSITTL